MPAPFRNVPLRLKVSVGEGLPHPSVGVVLESSGRIGEKFTHREGPVEQEVDGALRSYQSKGPSLGSRWEPGNSWYVCSILDQVRRVCGSVGLWEDGRRLTA